jgi:hypothetical protein
MVTEKASAINEREAADTEIVAVVTEKDVAITKSEELKLR